jgi:hypothetical protein
VSHPQIAAFARLADGGQMPKRAIYGQASKLSRSTHDIRYVEEHDEFVVASDLAGAIMTFRGGADGQEGPIRVIQGTNTDGETDKLGVDPIHDEIYALDSGRIRVYPRLGNGNVAPIRVIEGPDTQLKSAHSLAVDPTNNIIVVGLNSNFGSKRLAETPEARARMERGALLMFNRTDRGNVKPRAVIRGPRSGIVRINQMTVYPPRKLIIAPMPGIIDQMEPEDSFLGIWNYDDNGDVPPRWKIPAGPRTTLKKVFGVTLNPKNKEVIIADMRLNGVVTFSVPEIF